MNYLKIVFLLLFSAALVSPLVLRGALASQSATEAPTGFDNLTNGFIPQTEHDKNREEFEHQETIAEGLGPFIQLDPALPVTDTRSRVGAARLPPP
jgi:hypothetical protein